MVLKNTFFCVYPPEVIIIIPQVFANNILRQKQKLSKIGLVAFLTRFSTKPGYCNAEVGGGRASGWACGRQFFGFRSITLVCFGLLTLNLLYG